MRSLRVASRRHASPTTRNLRSISTGIVGRSIGWASAHRLIAVGQGPPYALTLKQGDRFDVRRVRKHVHDAGRNEFESMLLHERAGIARQRARMTRHVNHAPRRL